MPRHTDKLANMAASARKARARNIKLAKLFSLIIVVAAAFVGGFAVRGDAELLDTLGLTQLTGVTPGRPKGQRLTANDSKPIIRFQLAWARWRPS